MTDAPILSRAALIAFVRAQAEHANRMVQRWQAGTIVHKDCQQDAAYYEAIAVALSTRESITCALCEQPILDPDDVVCCDCYEASMKPLPEPVPLTLSRADCHTLLGLLVSVGAQKEYAGWVPDLRIRFLTALDAVGHAPAPPPQERTNETSLKESAEDFNAADPIKILTPHAPQERTARHEQETENQCVPDLRPLHHPEQHADAVLSVRRDDTADGPALVLAAAAGPEAKTQAEVAVPARPAEFKYCNACITARWCEDQRACMNPPARPAMPPAEMLDGRTFDQLAVSWLRDMHALRAEVETAERERNEAQQAYRLEREHKLSITEELIQIKSDLAAAQAQIARLRAGMERVVRAFMARREPALSLSIEDPLFATLREVAALLAETRAERTS